MSKIITGKKEYSHKLESGATLTYKDLPASEKRVLVFSSMKSGEMTNAEITKFTYEAMEAMIIGWSGFKDENDKELPFNKSIIKDFDEVDSMEFLSVVLMPAFKNLLAFNLPKKKKDEDN